MLVTDSRLHNIVTVVSEVMNVGSTVRYGLQVRLTVTCLVKYRMDSLSLTLLLTIARPWLRCFSALRLQIKWTLLLLFVLWAVTPCGLAGGCSQSLSSDSGGLGLRPVHSMCALW
jgi:hypothetical protein